MTAVSRFDPGFPDLANRLLQKCLATAADGTILVRSIMAARNLETVACILERHVEIKDVFQLGNYVIWVTPSGTALAIDANNGKEELSDEEIDKLFVAKK